MEPESEYEAQRRRNREVLQREFEKVFGKTEKIKNHNHGEFNIAQVPVRKIQMRKNIKVKVTQPRRRSLRIKGEKPSIEPDDSIDEDIFEDYRKSKIKKRSMPTIKLNTRRPKPKHPDDVTEEDVKGICYNSAGKDYDAVNGTTCHQCRQKTRDVKTVCKNPECFGTRGQFCGFCLFNRYGEDVANVLKIEKWACPPCRNICNCSICRTRLGKRPTGILLPIAISQGFSNVKDFLMEKEPQILMESDEEQEPKEETNKNYDSQNFPKSDNNCGEMAKQNAKDFNVKITQEEKIKSIDISNDLPSSRSNGVQKVTVESDEADEILSDETLSEDESDQKLSDDLDDTSSDEEDDIPSDVSPINETVEKASHASLSTKHSYNLDDSFSDDEISWELQKILEDESKARDYVLSVIF